jgi:hypothetical protein
MTSPHWNAALRYANSAAAYGFHVFPLSRSKLPAVRSAHRDEPDLYCRAACGRIGHGVHDATRDPLALRTLFAAAPWARGYGIACGRAPHHLLGVDLDVKDGLDGIAAFAHLAAAHGFTVPVTATIATPSGGLHLWLTAPADRRFTNSASLIAPGVDIRGSGGYLVGPGSLGTTGRYTFTPDSSPDVIAPAPPELLALLTPPPALARPRTPMPPAGGDGGRHLDALVKVVLDCGPRDLNSRLYWAAVKAFAAPSIDPDTATNRLLDAAMAKGHPEVGARRTIASAHRGTRGAAA